MDDFVRRFGDVARGRVAVHKMAEKEYGPTATQMAFHVIETGMFDAVIDCHIGYEGVFMNLAEMFFYPVSDAEHKKSKRWHLHKN